MGRGDSCPDPVQEVQPDNRSYVAQVDQDHQREADHRQGIVPAGCTLGVVPEALGAGRRRKGRPTDRRVILLSSARKEIL